LNILIFNNNSPGISSTTQYSKLTHLEPLTPNNWY